MGLRGAASSPAFFIAFIIWVDGCSSSVQTNNGRKIGESMFDPCHKKTPGETVEFGALTVAALPLAPLFLPEAASEVAAGHTGPTAEQCAAWEQEAEKKRQRDQLYQEDVGRCAQLAGAVLAKHPIAEWQDGATLNANQCFIPQTASSVFATVTAENQSVRVECNHNSSCTTIAVYPQR